MLELDSELVLHLSSTVRARRLDEQGLEVYRRIHAMRPEVLQGRDDSVNFTMIRETIEAANGFGVDDISDVCAWAYIRLVTDTEFFRLPQLRYFLEDPLIHPIAKGRNVVISFVLACQGRG